MFGKLWDLLRWRSLRASTPTSPPTFTAHDQPVVVPAHATADSATEPPRDAAISPSQSKPASNQNRVPLIDLIPPWPWLHTEKGRDLPANLLIDGNAEIIDRPRFRSIGERFTVRGDLVIGGTRGRQLSHERSRSSLVSLPEGLRVDGSLELRSCFRLRRLPADFRVGKSLLIADCDALSELPANLWVNGSLTILGGRSLTALPPGLCVTGDFHLAGTRITRLPDDLAVDGSLTIDGRSRIASIPIKRVRGNLVLRSSRCESLPAGLEIDGDLIMRGSRKLRRLPASLRVGGNIDLSDCQALEEIPADLHVGGSLTLRRCTALHSLPDGLEVPGALQLRGCTSLVRLGTGTQVGTARQFTGFSQRPTPPGWGPRQGRPRGITPALSVADCASLTELPEDIKVAGPIDVAGSGLSNLPRSLQSAQLLWRGLLVPPDVVFHPEKLEPLQVLQEENAELRRVMLERAGLETILEKLGAQTLDADTDAGGPRSLVSVEGIGHCYLRCRCPSTARQYLLRVPPTMHTCHQAAAWMAGFSEPDQYCPVQET